jgi:hypothetical protein
MTDASVESCHYLVKGLAGDQAESLNLDFPYHLTAPALGNWPPKTSRDDCDESPFS